MSQEQSTQAGAPEGAIRGSAIDAATVDAAGLTVHPTRLAPACCQCRHFFPMVDSADRCNHPAMPVDAIEKRPIRACAKERADDQPQRLCGLSGRLFEHRAQAGQV